MKKIFTVFIVTAAMIALFACQKPEVLLDTHLPESSDSIFPIPNLPARPYDYTNNFGNHWWLSDNSPPKNPLSDDGATLGRVLFYDKLLSSNNTVACASCHHQANGFADVVPFSDGFEGLLTLRNSMAISNLRMHPRFFWDGRAGQLEDMVRMPIKNHIEMGVDSSDHLYLKLKHTSYYPQLFTNAFQSPEITREKIAKALAQFLRSMVSVNSKFDEGEQIGFTNFSVDELAGRSLFLFQLPCGSCHWQGPFGSTDFANIGLDTICADVGVMEVTGFKGDEGAFKIPSLRNVALTAPYMHDGRFETLVDVINHYNSGILPHHNLDSRLRDNACGGWGNTDPDSPPFKMQLTREEIQQIEAFLNTLTDDRFITDVRFSDPFQ